MRRLFLLYFAFLLCQVAVGQTDYITSSPTPDYDCIADLNGNYGVLILSERSDLVVSITNIKNVNNYKITPVGKGRHGYYGYEVKIDKTESRSTKIEVSRRGDVYKTSFVVSVKPDFFKSFLISEVQRPIRIENQTQANSAVLDEELAQVEFTTTIQDLQVHCPDELGAEVKKVNKTGDNSISITTVSIPIKVLEAAKLKRERAQRAHDELEARLYKTDNAPDKDWETLDKLQEEVEKSEQELMELGSISISGKGTNKLTVDILDLKARQKMCYGVLLLKIEIPVDEFSAKVAEGGRLFALREYEGARRSFMNALQLKDAPMDLLPSVRTSIAHCDSCIKYESLTIRALKRIKELKQKDAVAQTDIMNYYGAAADFMTIANKYNPCEYYAKNIMTLETYIENMPLAMRFTIARWIVQRISAMEDGPFSGVELWAYYGDEPLQLNDYSSDRKFRHLVSNKSEDFKQLGISDDRGVVDIELNRKSLPTGFFFRPAVGNSKSPIAYTDATEVMSQSEGEYNKRQFRKKMYVKK
jgi:hypothetical protein